MNYFLNSKIIKIVILFIIIQLVTHSLSFRHLRMSWFPFITGSETRNWQFFSFSTWKMVHHFLLAFMVSSEKFSVLWILFPLYEMWCFTNCFKFTLLVFSFQGKLMLMCLGMRFPWTYVWGFSEFFIRTFWGFSQIWEIFASISSKCF